MSKAPRRPKYICSECGELYHRWKNRCPTCGRLNLLLTLEEAQAKGIPLPLAWTAAADKKKRVRTGIAAFDEMASKEGGVVLGGCYFLSGAPGAGKSSLTLKIAHAFGQKRKRALYALIEEEGSEVHARAIRFGLGAQRIWGIEPESIEELCEKAGNAQLIILDSLQGLHDRSGAKIVDIAKFATTDAHENGRTWILIGHIIKSGDAAGVEEIQHVVDATLELSGDDSSSLRIISSKKNRFAPTDRRTFMRMQDNGLVDVPDATSYLLADRVADAPGIAIAAAVLPETQTAVLIEVQAAALPVPLTDEGKPIRAPTVSASGIAAARLRIPLAMLSRHGGIDTSGLDLFVKVVGGNLGVEDDLGLDLPVALAIASAIRDAPLPADLCAWGELGLAGEVRSVRESASREREAARSAFRTCVGQKRLADVLKGALGDACGRASPSVESAPCSPLRRRKSHESAPKDSRPRSSIRTRVAATSTHKARPSPSRRASKRK